MHVVHTSSHNIGLGWSKQWYEFGGDITCWWYMVICLCQAQNLTGFSWLSRVRASFYSGLGREGGLYDLCVMWALGRWDGKGMRMPGKQWRVNNEVCVPDKRFIAATSTRASQDNQASRVTCLLTRLIRFYPASVLLCVRACVCAHMYASVHVCICVCTCGQANILNTFTQDDGTPITRL